MGSKHPNSVKLIRDGVFNSVETFNELEVRITNLYSENTKSQGDAFEIFFEAYLATQPIMQCKEVWIVGNIPEKIRIDTNLPSDTKGIDGIFESTLNELIPYQVKFRSKRSSLSYNEVASFLGITEKAATRILVTNADRISADVENRTAIRIIKGNHFDSLTTNDFAAIETWLKSNRLIRHCKLPLPYQQDALDDIHTTLEKVDRCNVVMACGTGKTLIALWAAKAQNAKNIVVFVPTLALLRQTIEEWSKNSTWDHGLSYICVCSDQSLTNENDDLEIALTDLPFLVNTEYRSVDSYLRQTNIETKIVFTTYHSSHIISEATKDRHKFDIGIFDEAHKTVGDSDRRHALALSDDCIDIKKRIFFTATPKRYLQDKYDEDGKRIIYSMDDTSVYGPRAHTLSFGKAVKLDLICPFKLIVSIVDSDEVEKYRVKFGATTINGADLDAKGIADRIAISKAINLTKATKIITFHSRVSAAKSFADIADIKYAEDLEGFEVFHINGKQRVIDRVDTLRNFKISKKALITNSRCLTEGVDIPSVDLVVFIDPKRSRIDIAQAVGRSMRKSIATSKKFGYVLLPIYAEGDTELDIVRAVESEKFGEIVSVVDSLSEVDADFFEEIRMLGDADSDRVKSSRNGPERIEFILPITHPSTLLNAITVKLVDHVNLLRSNLTWDEWFLKLSAYTRKYGSSNVPRDYVTGDGFKLGEWVYRQRQRQSFDSLTSFRLEKLQSISDWSWNLRERNWEDAYSGLQRFVNVNGTCAVPIGYIDMASSTNLYDWIVRQRANFEKLSDFQRSSLDSLNGWVWNVRDSKWWDGYTYLQQYINLKGDSDVRAAYSDPISEFPLGQWVLRQRKRKLLLPSDRLDALNSISGWQWESQPIKKKLFPLRGLYFFETKIAHKESGDKFAFLNPRNLNYFTLFHEDYEVCVVPKHEVKMTKLGADCISSSCPKCSKAERLPLVPSQNVTCIKCGTSWMLHWSANGLGV